VWGEQFPTNGEEATPWTGWEKAEGMALDIVGDQLWGQGKIKDSEVDVSPVWHTNSGTGKTFTVELSKYQSGTGSVRAYIRGSDQPFDQWNVSIPWQEYTGPYYAAWWYFQVKLEFVSE
jgi:hypothetical protein